MWIVHAVCELLRRSQTLLDFKNGHRTLMIATSVAGRGLDVKNLVLVINYNCPNHLEDYIHRCVRRCFCAVLCTPAIASASTVFRQHADDPYSPPALPAPFPVSFEEPGSRFPTVIVCLCVPASPFACCVQCWPHGPGWA